MLTQFEHFAVAEMLGKPDSPPRANGTLCFGSEWERTSFGIALALAKEGYFEWDDFRDELIASIGKWEGDHPSDHSSWNYYDQFLTALESAVVKTNLLAISEIRELFGVSGQANPQ
ncbi:nitrile hydratase accessory protein [Neorhizobium huautlense]|uniref:nitrile hydratase accessory protein n=1 Tax=Neorhizobium huautlense TaxID=67774 RepID=UPI000CF91529|nr:nitrile hydratase accessory protein [Neorhizobium huautlense]